MTVLDLVLLCTLGAVRFGAIGRSAASAFTGGVGGGVTSHCACVDGRCASAIMASSLLQVGAAEPVWLVSRTLPRFRPHGL